MPRSHRHSPKKGCLRHQGINRASPKRVRAWSNSTLRLEEYISVGCVIWVLDLSGTHVKQPRPTITKDKTTPTRSTPFTPRLAEACHVHEQTTKAVNIALKEIESGWAIHSVVASFKARKKKTKEKNWVKQIY